MDKTPQTTILAARYVFDGMACVGRGLMIDFGLAGLFDKFEEILGSRLTKALLALIAAAVAVVCLRVIAETISPLATWLNQTAEGNVFAWVALKITNFAYYALPIFFALYLLGMRQRLKEKVQTAEGRLAAAEARIDSLVANLENMEVFVTDVKKEMTEVEDSLARSIELSEGLDDEELKALLKDTFRSLLRKINKPV